MNDDELNRSGRGSTEILAHQLLEGTEENHEDSQ
jgi:hypothetical protein